MKLPIQGHSPIGLPQKLSGGVVAPHGAIMRCPLGLGEKGGPGLPWARLGGAPCSGGGGNILMCMHQQWYSVCVDALANMGRGCGRTNP